MVETLTADTSDISDPDGVENAVFAYQWIAGGAEIEGATESNYTLTESEQGMTVQVRVSFTDDAGNEEALTSVGTGAVAPVLPPLTVSLTAAAPATHDGSAEFTFEIEFSGRDTATLTPESRCQQIRPVLSLTQGSCTRVRRLAGNSRRRPRSAWRGSTGMVQDLARK